MQVYPFAGYLNHFPSSYDCMEVERERLEEFAFPVRPEIMENRGTGLAPIKRGEKDFFNVRELIGHARAYSIPNLGFISRKPIRPAEILKTEMILDEESGEERIKTVYVACAFLRSDARPAGQVVFICPFCGCLHSHGCDGQVFGDGNGDREPHCLCDMPAYFRQDFQKYGLLLAPNWHFHLVEAEDATRAGDFPKAIARDLFNRCK